MKSNHRDRLHILGYLIHFVNLCPKVYGGVYYYLYMSLPNLLHLSQKKTGINLILLNEEEKVHFTYLSYLLKMYIFSCDFSVYVLQ